MTIDEEKKNEENLRRLSYTDEQTGLSNRNSYELDSRELAQTKLKDKFVYMSMDVNGLKKINDTLGHVAGDELIRGAAECFKETVGKYGKVYRIGGDEFAAIIYATEKQIQSIEEEFSYKSSRWKGQYIDRISVSVGIVSRSECPDLSFDEIELLADERMYAQKVKHYQNA